ncbi:hypothetical protein [Glaciimonas immobilis]|uniref:ABC-type amino acid transport substrate-binding protein n=1 Tax=Glaciimonas immobilis TaxID=728004 RepID=A0A840RQM9_9BURK|nr:hypothetical protein [Glaciimonas immobilis]KAF3997353.1 hypothetical protein HAV38_13030 [Glaciimonas immobilis]MBB5200717.1 ABC-type amino acid transport substrate-binding protein [Glaciimonas immobilis]
MAAEFSLILSAHIAERITDAMLAQNSPGARYLRDKVNAILAETRKDGELYAISVNWLGHYPNT